MRTGLVLLVLVRCAVLISGQSSAPCVPCQNGGICNRSQLQVAYGDTYGTCTCPVGFSGVACETSTASLCNPPCAHNTTCAGGRCACGAEFFGATCSAIACSFQQRGGSGPFNTSLPDSRGRCGTCDLSRTGPFCRQLTGCAAGQRMIRDPFAMGLSGSMTCGDIPGATSWPQLIQGSTTMLLQLKKPSPWEKSTEPDGSATVQFLRKGFVSGSTEEVFSCTLNSCYQKISRVDQVANPAYDLARASIQEPPASIAMRILICIASLGCSVAVVVTPKGVRRIAFALAILSVTLFCVLYIVVAMPLAQMEGSGTIQLVTTSGEPRVVAELVCADTACECNFLANDQPSCSLTAFASYIRSLKGTSTFSCDNITGVCIFNNANFFQGTVQLAFSCNATTCLDYDPNITFASVKRSDVASSTSTGVAIMAIAFTCAGIVALALLLWCAAASYSRAAAASGAATYEVADGDISVRCENVSYGTSDKRILDNVSCCFPGGKITALLGPSGAGKSTLLDIIALRDKSLPMSGVVTFCGAAEPAWLLRREFGYAADSPSFVETLTVRETLNFSARLRLPGATSTVCLSSVVNWLLSVFGLNAVSESLVVNLSAGESRRLRVATLLSGFPRIMLLDEPTSGLDSYSAKLVIETLRTAITVDPSTHGVPFSQKQRCVVLVTVHQPSPDLLLLFDEVALLGKGKLAFQGDIVTFRSWISDHEGVDADREEDLASRAISLLCCDATLRPFAEPKQCPGLAAETFIAQAHHTVQHGLVPHEQLLLLMQRDIISLTRKPGVLFLHYLISTVAAITLSVMYGSISKDAAGILSKAGLISFSFLWIALTHLSVIDVIHAERAAVCSERYHSLHRSPIYLLSKLATDVVILRILPAILTCCIIYVPCGFRLELRAFLSFTGINVLFSLAMSAIAFCFAARSESFGVAALGYGFSVILAFAFGGFVSSRDTLPAILSWIPFLSPFYLGFVKLMTTDLFDQLCIFTPRDANGSPTSDTLTLNCAQYLFTLGVHPSESDLDAGLLVLWSVLLAGAAALFVDNMSFGRR